MLVKTVFMLIVLLSVNSISNGQPPETYQQLNDRRIQTNKTGMKILGTWGAANIVAGIAGYGVANNNEWRSFHQMNAIWGVVNLGIAASGYFGAKREAGKSFTFAEGFEKQQSNTKLFLLNAGLDGLYLGTGIYLIERARNENNRPEVWRGYGKSILVQGIGLLIFDVVMYASHNNRNKSWYRLLSGINISGHGVGLTYRF